MNKHIKKIIEILGNKPSHSQSEAAKTYLQKVITSGAFKPTYSSIHKDVNSFSHVAITLPISCIGEHYKETVAYGEINREVDYIVCAELCEDYYEWVNFFVCISDDGKDYVVGDFEEVVYFSSKKFYNQFIEENPVEVWDYWDI